jgi:hypothetical protein
VNESVTGQEQGSTILEDATIAGLIGAPEFEVEITPFKDEVKKRTFFKASGDVRGALEKIARNYPIGSRTALESIKRCRSMIWLFKEGQ